MARKKSTDTIEAEIKKVKSDMSKLQDRYDKLADKLKELQDLSTLTEEMLKDILGGQ